MTAEILLVDDNAVQATTRRAILVRSGRSVAVASGAAQGLQMLQDDEELFRSISLVITDHWMPGLNGPEFVAKLRERLPNIPVLVLSGLADAEGEYEGMKVIFRVKPFPPDMLIALTSSILDEPYSRTA